MKSVHLFLIALIVFAGLLSGCIKKEDPAQQSNASKTTSGLGQKAASLEGLTYVKGDPVTFETGKVYVVEFWATWCPPCRTSIPHLTEVQKQYKDKGVTVIGISNEDTAAVKPFVEKMGDKMEYTVALDTGGKANKGYMAAFNKNGIPAAFIVDGKGNVAWVGHPMSGLETALDKLVAETANKGAMGELKTPEKGNDAENVVEAGPEVNIEIPAEPAPTVTETPTVPKAAALEGLTYVKGDPVTFESGKVYVVEFWATWCGPCRTSIPHLTEVQAQFKDKGVTVIGISNEDAATVKPFVEKMGKKMEYTVALDAEGKASQGYMEAFNQRGIPAAFIVNGEGNIAWYGHPMDGLDDVLEQVVAGTFDPVAYAKGKTEREAAERELRTLFGNYFTGLISDTTVEQARPTAEKIIETNNPMVLNELAWGILTVPDLDEAKRDVEIALKAAGIANTETNGENPMVLDTYALALFKNNKIAEAISTQQKAITLAAGNEEMQANLKTRLDKFQAALEQTKEP